jgi:hypothetical protein
MTTPEITAIADKYLDRWFAEDPQTSTRTLCSFVEEAIAEALEINNGNWRKGRETERHEMEAEITKSKTNMVTKQFGMDFNSSGGALTLSPTAVTDSGASGGTHTRAHESGWTITGEIHEDYYEWVNDFEATHPTFGKVWGNFESVVHADSEEGFAHFWKNHEPTAWDYMDI